MNEISFLNLKKTLYMKTNKYSDLIKFGLSQKTLLSLSESEINVLHKNLIEGEQTKTAPKTKPGTKTPPKTRPSHPGKNPNPGVSPAPAKAKKKEETKEAVTKTSTTTTFDLTNVADAQAANKAMMDKGLNAEINPTTRKMNLTTGEVKEEKKKSKKTEVNPWAVCHSQLGPKKTAKFERCVKQVKKSISEGKNPYAVLLENKILSLVEKYTKPKMKKGELMDLIGKKKMNYPIGKLGSIGVANEDVIDAPTTKPGTKPGTKTPPKTRPSHPGKNPNPGVNPTPKAKSPENVKSDMIKSIMNVINNK